MGTIVCQDCQGVLEVYEDEKVSVLYASSESCNCNKNK